MDDWCVPRLDAVLPIEVVFSKVIGSLRYY